MVIHLFNNFFLWGLVNKLCFIFKFKRKIIESTTLTSINLFKLFIYFKFNNIFSRYTLSHSDFQRGPELKHDTNIKTKIKTFVFFVRKNTNTYKSHFVIF